MYVCVCVCICVYVCVCVCVKYDVGIVYELRSKSDSNRKRYAMKEMEIKNAAQMKMALREAEMLKDIMENISHPNILHIEKVFQVSVMIYMFYIYSRCMHTYPRRYASLSVYMHTYIHIYI